MEAYINIDVMDSENDYKYCSKSMTVYKNDSEYNLFDLYTFFSKNNFTLEEQLEICKRMIIAYERGIEEAKREISNKFNMIIGYNTKS